MLTQILLFEIKYRLQRPVTYIYFLILFLICFLITAIPGLLISEAGEQLQKNAPYIILQILSGLMLVSSVIVAGIMGVPVYRDYECNFNEIVFSLPIRKWDYLGGKFLGSYVITVLVHLGMVFGLMLGTLMPWVEKSDLGPFVLEAYINPIFIFIIPNVFVLGVIFFAVGSAFRSQLAIYSQGLILIVLYFLLSRLMADVDTNPISSVFEPFGSVAASFETKYWTTFEKNTLFLPLTGYVLINRLVWMGIATVIGIFFLIFFNPSARSTFSGRKGKVHEDSSANRLKLMDTLTTIAAGYSASDQLYQWWYFSRFHFFRMIRAVPFIVMMACGIGVLLIAQYFDTTLGTPSLPVTYVLLDFLKGSFIIFAIIIIALYTGELIWKDIDVKFAPVVDAAPIPDWLIVLSKFSAMIFMELFMLFIIMMTGISVQLYEGFYDFQLAVYAKVLLLGTFPYLVILTFLVFLIHTLINSKYLGHTLVVMFFLINLFAGNLGLEHILARYGSSIQESYSDMNGYHHFVFPALVIDFYWITLGSVFLILSMLFIKRGSERSFKARLASFKVNYKHSGARWIIPSLLLVFVLTGSYIFYNTNILNTFRTRNERRENKALFERTYSKYKNYPQPRLVNVYVNADLYPRDIRCDFRGTFILTNKHHLAIDTFHVRTLPDIKINKISFSHPVALVDSSDNYGYYIYKCLKPFNPGDTITFEFDLSYQERGFNRWGHSTNLVYNGTYLQGEFLPSFGYRESEEIQDKKDRKKEGLPGKIYESSDIMDSTRYNDNYVSQNADRISYEAVISTAPDQIAITCGTLVKEWTDSGRRYFHFKMNKPVWNFFPFLSARYEVYREIHNGLIIEIYHHKSHDYNVRKMAEAMKKTVDYCNAHFSPYQYEVLRIVEFPRYSSSAQSYAGTIPFSESLGFILKNDEQHDVDLPFFITAHEVAHQWWGHQIMAADVKGKTLLVESLAEYTAFMVMLNEYGEDKASRFLKYEIDRYMQSRAGEKKKEPPLYLVDDQQYLSYQKGCLAFYNLMDFLGEDSLNYALSRFIHKYKNQDAPYPTSLDLLAYVRKAMPDSIQYLIKDWFETITLYDNRVDSAYYTKTPNGKFLVNILTTSRKYQADSLGKQEPLPLSDWIEVGVFAKNLKNEDTLIYLKKVQLKVPQNVFRLTVDQEPSAVGIDPMYKQIDRNLFDNRKVIKKKT